MDLAISQTLVKKLNPNRFTAMSGKMAAMLGYVLSVEWTQPAIREINITSDGFLVSEGDFLGGVDEWKDNLERLFKAAELTAKERNFFYMLHARRINDWRRHEGGVVVMVGA